MIKDLNLGYYYTEFDHFSSLKSVYLWTPYCRDLEVGQLGVDYLQKMGLLRRIAVGRSPTGQRVALASSTTWFPLMQCRHGLKVVVFPELVEQAYRRLHLVATFRWYTYGECLFKSLFDYLNSNTKTRDKPTIIYKINGIHRWILLLFSNFMVIFRNITIILWYFLEDSYTVDHIE